MDPLSLPEGHYAIVDPHDPKTVTYWRRKDLTTRRGGVRPQFAAWPLKAKNGPILLKRDVPRGLHGAERQQWVNRWFRDHRDTYITAVVQAIAADSIAAQRRFAEMTCRCCFCGRTLVDELSKVYGIGPDCRTGIPAETLATYLTPRVGEAHAEYLRSAQGQCGEAL